MRFVLLAMLYATLSCGSPRTSSPTPEVASLQAPASTPARVDEPSSVSVEPSFTSPAAPVPASPSLEQQIREAIPPYDTRPVADPPPHPVGEGWVTPNGAPITHTFVLGWSRPKEQDGWPTTVFYSEPERTAWLHEGFLRGGLSTVRVWFGPFVLGPAP